jgi:flagellin
MRINHNIASLNTYRQLATNNANGGKSLEKLSSGLRINRAGDDAAGLAISEKMRAQIRGLDQAARNAQDGISMIQTAEGALAETHSILQRMRELAVQSATDTNTADDRAKIQAEVDQLAKEITRISNTTEFNTQNLLAGGLNNTFHVGANAGQNVSLTISAMDAQSLGVAGTENIMTSAFNANGTGLTSVSNMGTGLVEGTDYTVNVDVTLAAEGSAIAMSQNGADTAAIDGTEGKMHSSTTGTINYSGYTGTTDTTYQIRVASVSTDAVANDITGIQVSKDGGTTWSTTISVTAAATDIGDGLTYSRATAAAGTGYVVGDTLTFTANAAYADIKLQKGGTDIGTETRVFYNSNSAIIGDQLTGKTVTANYSFSSLTDGTTNQFTVSEQKSTAAIFSNGVMTNQAVTRSGISVSTQNSANTAITTINKALETVSAERSKLGAMQNRLEHTINNLGTSSENLTASESRIRDVDMAKEMMEFTKNNILTQAAQAMLAQANQQPQGVLQLLR